jgi:hypothetical protein
MGAGALVVYSSGPAMVAPHRTRGVVLDFLVNVAFVFLYVGYHRIAGRGVRCPSLDMLFI